MTLPAPLEPTKIGAGGYLRDGDLHRVLGETEGRCQQPQRQYNQQGGVPGAGANTCCRGSAHNCAGGGNCAGGDNAKADGENAEGIRDIFGGGGSGREREEEGEGQQERGPHHSDRKIPQQHRWPAHDLARRLLDRNPKWAEDPSETTARAFDKDRPIGAEHHAEALVKHGDPHIVPGNSWKRYELKVVQQPVRARMCGFGDKDRRPATPPPVVELIVRNAHGTEIDVPSLDVSFYVVTCDVFSADGLREVNLIVHSTAGAMEANQSGRRWRRKGERKIESSAAGEERRPCLPPINTSDAAAKRDSRGMTRNLVGVLVANAVKLTRLDAEPVAEKNASDSVARTFSDVFTVYCAKKFPGMIDSTPLSRWFAHQGVKIHGRRDKPGRRRVSQAEEVKPAAEEERNLGETVESMSVPLSARDGGLVGSMRIVQADE